MQSVTEQICIFCPVLAMVFSFGAAAVLQRLLSQMCRRCLLGKRLSNGQSQTMASYGLCSGHRQGARNGRAEAITLALLRPISAEGETRACLSDDKLSRQTPGLLRAPSRVARSQQRNGCHVAAIVVVTDASLSAWTGEPAGNCFATSYFHILMVSLSLSCSLVQVRQQQQSGHLTEQKR